MLQGVAIERLVSEGFTREEAEYLLSNITVDLKRIYSIRVDHKRHTVKVEATHLSPEDLFKEAFVYFVTDFMKEHKEEFIKDPCTAAKLLRVKVDLLQTEACRSIAD